MMKTYPNDKYFIKLAFYTQDSSMARSAWSRLQDRITDLFTRSPEYSKSFTHVDIVDMAGNGIGPIQGEKLALRKRLYTNRAYDTFLRITMDREDYKRVMEFLIHEADEEIQFDYCGFLNFIWCLPTYWCMNIDNTRDGWFSKRKYFCSAFALKVLQLLKPFRNPVTVGAQAVASSKPCRTSVTDLYILVRNTKMYATSDTLLDEGLYLSNIELHNRVMNELGKENDLYTKYAKEQV
jgi:hypothetical protein